MEHLNDDIINRYLAGNYTEDDLDKINRWIGQSDDNARYFFRLEEAYQLGKAGQKDMQGRLTRAEQRLYQRLAAERRHAGHTARFRPRRWMAYAAAAVLAIGVLTFAHWYLQSEASQNMVTIVATGGKVRMVTLPDSTRVWLNDSSQLRYPRRFTRDVRLVHVEGEAYFEVTKNKEKPFIVQSDAMQVRVLGTVFNFKSSPRLQIDEATLIQGEIEVKGNKNEGMVVLSPGQRAELDRTKGRLTVRQVEAGMDAVWHDNLIRFDKINIPGIARNLERFYGVKIVISPHIHTGRTYSGVLKRKDSIDSVLALLQNTIPIRYKIKGKTIYLYPAEKAGKP